MTIEIGGRAPDFALESTDGEVVSLGSLGSPAQARLVAVIFSCNHCPYVRAWETRMIAIQSDFADRGVRLVAINANDDVSHPADSFDAMKVRAVEQGFNFPYLRDETQEVARAYGAERTPEVFLLDEERRLVYHGAIDDNYEEPDGVVEHYLRSAIERSLAGEPVGPHSTPPVGCTIKWRR